jgi:hypothetical protein
MGGRFLEIPVSYGYDTGGPGSTGRQIRRSLRLLIIAILLRQERGKERGPRKASRVNNSVPVPQTDTGGRV